MDLVLDAQLEHFMMPLLKFAEFLAMLTKFIIFWQKSAIVLKIHLESMESAQNVQERLNMMQNLNYAYASQDTVMLTEFASLDVVLIKFYQMEFAAVKLDITLLEEFVEDADGTRFMIKGLVFAEFHAIKREFIILP